MEYALKIGHLCVMIKLSSGMRYIMLTTMVLLSLLACRDGQVLTKVESLEIFKVEGNEANKKPSELTYKEVKFYNDDNFLYQQHYYSVDNKLKGFEVIKKDGNKAVSNYYALDSTILAIYEIEFDGVKEVSRKGYDGQSKEHLRTETYTYDANENRIGKEIYTSDGALTRIFGFTHDAYGNEIGFSIKDDSGKMLTQEEYKISKSDSQNRWIEKWGYVNDMPKTFHRRTLK